ncbi:hypothetical protein Plec18167_008431 [Paecilomyces lecythidis]|uniref:Short-chain dehydrogenase/reductase n=1 Tax=Paecilomyces lecythidis TaxID=3004212 RepID=A0ABR3WWA8_9EURO
MVSLQTVRSNNVSLKELGPGLVAVFVGGTSGIGESTAREFVRHTLSPRVYLVGRNETQASKIIEELRSLNPDGKVSFIKSDVSLLRSVDEACEDIKKREERVNLLFMSCGFLSTKGRDETPEGLDKKLNVHYYSRMRFIYNLLPQLTAASSTSTTNNRPLSRVVSVLGAGQEGSLDLSDLALKHNYSMRTCAAHAITMNSLMTHELASQNPGTSFIHAYPGVVKTGVLRELGPLARFGTEVFSVLAKPFMVPLEESGERHLYAATSQAFIPNETADKSAAAVGSDGVKGSGGYLLHWNGDTVGKQDILRKYREEGVGKTVWQHTLDVFQKPLDALAPIPPVPGPSLLLDRLQEELALVPIELDGELDTDAPREDVVEPVAEDAADVDGEDVVVTTALLAEEAAVAAVGLHVAQMNTLKPRPSQREQMESLVGGLLR